MKKIVVSIILVLGLLIVISCLQISNEATKISDHIQLYTYAQDVDYSSKSKILPANTIVVWEPDDLHIIMKAMFNNDLPIIAKLYREGRIIITNSDERITYSDASYEGLSFITFESGLHKGKSGFTTKIKSGF